MKSSVERVRMDCDNNSAANAVDEGIADGMRADELGKRRATQQRRKTCPGQQRHTLPMTAEHLRDVMHAC